MKRIPPEFADVLFARVRAAVLDGPGVLAPSLRRAAATVGKLAGAAATYVELVRHTAYKVTDEHHAAMRAEGHDDDSIFELTLATAVGAADERRAAGLAAIDAAVAERAKQRVA
jgi:hypothetical protein